MGIKLRVQQTLFVALLTVVGSASATAAVVDKNQQGLEDLAYSYAMQAYLYSFPLTIADRELKRREGITESKPNSPLAPVNRLAHMTRLADHKTNMPYSPNNDTVYSAGILDISKEPIILQMPSINDRFAVVQVANAYFENQPYVYSPRVNGAQAVNMAFVPKNWQGVLPAGVRKVEVDTNHVILAIRIALQDASELEKVRAYQSQIRLRALSDWNRAGNPLPAIPVARSELTLGDGPFAYFQRVAELMKTNPPPQRHKAINAALWRVGLIPGQSYQAQLLDPASRRGVERALADAPKVIDYLSRNRGKRFPNNWDAGRYAQDIVFDYAARAAMALVGLMGNDPEEAIYLYTYFDSQGQALDASKSYRMHFPKGSLPGLQDKGFWSLTMYDGKTFRYVKNSIERFSLGDRSPLKFNSDGSLDIWIQNSAPSEDKLSNWLPSAQSGSFRLTFRIYGPDEDTVKQLYDIDLTLPAIEPLM